MKARGVLSVISMLLVAASGVLSPARAQQADAGSEGAFPEIASGLECKVCGMYIDRFRATAALVVFHDDQSAVYCGVACALRDIDHHGGASAIQKAFATDWPTGEMIALETATIVVGSDLIPDMVPNFIAFRSQQEATRFAAEHGGVLLSFDEALGIISPFGMTMPFRITPAATPPSRVLSTGLAFARTRMNNLMRGDDEIGRDGILASRGRAPKEMRGTKIPYKIGYGITDNLYALLVVPYVEKRMRSVVLQENGTTREMTRDNDGLGDVEFSLRWRLYRNVDFSRHFSVLVGASLPTGDYDDELRATPGLQVGTGAASLIGGVLYTHRIDKLWIQAAVAYNYKFENSDEYKFGDALTGGIALHYTPTPYTLLGLEIDARKEWANEDNGVDVANSGRGAVFASLVGQQRIANFGGGNLNLRAMIGLPLYEDVEGVQLGEDYHMAVGLTWKVRF